MDYKVDLRDVKFQALDWLPTAELLEAERFGDWDRESVEMVIDEALKIAQQKLAPANEEGDRAGAVWQEGRVTVPRAYVEANRTVVEGGWIGCTNNPEYGGQGLPHLVGTVVNEFFAGANLGLCLSYLLTRGAAHLIERHGTPEMRELFCRRLYSGEWGGTMCLTEPQAGSDVGASTSKAVKQENGRYLLSGEKIFITFGEHDLADNIVHTVLARVPGAPEGTKGLSLFVVPKIRVSADGALGQPNDVYCAGIEHKLGIHGSPTCSILFGQNEACEAMLLGDEGDGMRLMFEMMNAARIEVGLQGAAVAGAAHQAALAFAKERVQGRHWTKLRDRSAAKVAIVEHPDVRRMLLTSSAYVQAMRALLLQTSYLLDRAEIAEGEERERYDSYVEVLTPICKAWGSDWGFRVTEWCLQVFGGYGYTKDYPAEQYLRDAKIASIYEGTNGIQALDLVGRKLGTRGGEAVKELLGMAAATAERAAADAALGPSAALLGDALGRLQRVFTTVPKRDDAALLTLLNAVPILEMTGSILGAHFLLDQSLLAASKLEKLLVQKSVDPADAGAYRGFLAKDPDAAFLHDKTQAAIHFCHRVLPTVAAHATAIEAGETAPMDAVM